MIKYFLRLFMIFSVLLILSANYMLADASSNEKVEVSVLFNSESGKFVVLIRNCSDRVISFHMKTIDCLQQAWVVRGVLLSDDETKKSGQIYSAELVDPEIKSAIKKERALDRTVDLKPGEGIGKAFPVEKTAFWADLLEKGIRGCDQFIVSAEPQIYLSSPAKTPIKASFKQISKSLILRKQEIIKVEGRNLEREVKAPPKSFKESSKEKSETASVMDTPSEIPKISIGVNLAMDTKLLTISVRSIVSSFLSIHMNTIEDLNGRITVNGYSSKKNTHAVYTYDPSYYSSFEGMFETDGLDRTVVLKCNEIVCKSIDVRKTDFWNDLIVRGIGLKNAEKIRFNALLTLRLFKEGEGISVDKAERDINPLIIDKSVLLGINGVSESEKSVQQVGEHAENNLEKKEKGLSVIPVLDESSGMIEVKCISHSSEIIFIKTSVNEMKKVLFSVEGCIDFVDNNVVLPAGFDEWFSYPNSKNEKEIVEENYKRNLTERVLSVREIQPGESLTLGKIPIWKIRAWNLLMTKGINFHQSFSMEALYFPEYVTKDGKNTLKKYDTEIKGTIVNRSKLLDIQKLIPEKEQNIKPDTDKTE